MATQIDIDSEYEKLFGKKEPINLFDSGEEYVILRQEILTQSIDVQHSLSLPFEDIRVYPYAEYLWNKSIKDAKEKGYHLFYIKQKAPFCNAAGYYDPAKRFFVLLKSSSIVDADNFDIEHVQLLFGRRNFLMNKIVRDKHTCIIREDAIIDNPLISASYVLGIVAEASQWRDEKGRNLLDFYPELAQLHRKEEEKKQEREGNEKKRRGAILNIVKSIELYIKIKEQRHIFCIEEKGVCKAEGYFDPESRYFFITRGSLVARESDIIYANCPSGKSRLRFLDKVCVLQQSYYLVKKDAKCRSATAAACYVLGHFASYVNLKDKDGKHLNEVFPNVSFNVDPDVQGDNSKSFNSTDQHVFYIIRNNGSKRACHATGKYDATNNKFIILKDSVLSLDVAWSYSSSPSDTMRRNFIKQHCVKQHNGYVVIKDAICDSPSAAASFILGRNANGWSEWKDKENRTMKDVLKNSFCQ